MSPLEIRSSYRRLRGCPQRSRLIRVMLWPFPWRFNHTIPPENMANAGPNEKIIAVLQPGIRQLYCIPVYRWRDSPLCSVYRMVEDLCARDLIMMGYECEYLWFRSGKRWRLEAIPDPEEEDPVIYALLASMVEALVTAFNWKLSLGLRRNGEKYAEDDRATNFPHERVPPWTASVKPLRTQLDLLLNLDGVREGNPNPHFLQRNILAPTGDLYNI